jgi:uncharacterized SAM-binding protein YcdF (DUF218 family)
MAPALAMTGFAGWGRRWWLVPAILALVWGVGFLWFLRLAAQPAAPLGRADGIVVLTGGAERIEAGLRLLADGRAPTMLISGIGGKADLAALAHGSGVDTTALAERVKLGREATSTHGNALETATWVRDNRIATLIVVTAWYHMPRALTELHRIVPGVMLLPEPVRAPVKNGRPDPGVTGTTKLLIEEYTKYLVAVTGLTAYLPMREATRTP